MPTYPYACTACDHRFEQVQAFSDPSLTECPECGGRLRKVFSSVGIVFKGSGWYRNDSRSGSSGSSSEKSDSSDSGSSEKADKPAATKTESTSEKPAAAKEKSGATSGSSSSGTGSTAASSA